MARKKHIIDASGEKPGRLATRIARILMGKHRVSYVPYRDMGEAVVITNADKIVFSGKKIDQKEYKRHSMYPGGLKLTPAKKVLAENPKEIIRHAVERMIPKNKMRSARLRRLVFKV